MAAISGRKSEIWTQTGASVALTKQACEAVTTTRYHVTDPTKRYLDPATAILVYVSDVLQTSGYHISGGCQIHFDSVPGGAVTLTGAYFTMAEVTLCQSWEATIDSQVYEITSLGDTAAKFQGSDFNTWGGSLSRLYENDTWGAKAAANATQHVLRLFADQPAGLCWTGWANITGWQQTTPQDDLERETISWQGIGEIVYTLDET